MVQKLLNPNTPQLHASSTCENIMFVFLNNKLLIRITLKPNSTNYIISRYGKKYEVKLASLGGCL